LGVKYLVAQGIADPRHTVIFGGSYGGYAALAGVAFTPNVYVAAASLVGPSDLIATVDSLTSFAPPTRSMFYERVGDPTNAEDRGRLERKSPSNSVAQIKAPLLVIQGANDPVVPRAETDRLVNAMRARGASIEYLVAADEAHVLGVGMAFARAVNNRLFLQRWRNSSRGSRGHAIKKTYSQTSHSVWRK
jgi:dipeptidyl aminopeptidase/acylaminoacyl peptidase